MQEKPPFSHRVFLLCSRLPLKGVVLPSMRKYQQGVGVFKKRSERAERKGQHVRNAEGMFYKLVLMENLYLGLTWPLL